MTAGHLDLTRVDRARRDPRELLSLMDDEGIERAALINYVAPDVMGFTEETNDWVCAFVKGSEDRLVAVGSIHPHRTRDARSDVARLFETGVRMLKIHPPHQVFAANAYRDGDETLGQIYAAAQEHGRPVMIHTGTSIFPGARNRYADPMAADDVAVDFPRLPLILAHAGRPLFMPTDLDEEKRGGVPGATTVRGCQGTDSLEQRGRPDPLTGGRCDRGDGAKGASSPRLLVPPSPSLVELFAPLLGHLTPIIRSKWILAASWSSAAERWAAESLRFALSRAAPRAFTRRTSPRADWCDPRSSSPGGAAWKRESSRPTPP